MMRRTMRASLAIMAAALGWTGQVHYAEAQEDQFSRDRNVSVRGRAKPEYDAAGIRAGSFRAFPEVLIAAEYNDNVFATNANEDEDVIVHIDPSVSLQSLWSVHELNFGLSAPSRIYSEFDDSNTTDLIGEVDGRLDVRRDFSINGGARYGALHEPISSSPTNSLLAEPTDYANAEAHLGVVKAFNRLRLSGQARYSSHDYDDAVLQGGGSLEQDDRDRDVIMLGARADYAISPLTALFMSFGTNERDYDLDPPDAAVNRDSSGYEVLGGANFDLTRLMRGEIGVGYLSQEYDEPGVGDSSGLAVRANVEWFPDDLVTVSFGAAREVGDAGAVGAASYISNNMSFRVDYEWRRNIVLGVRTDISRDEYNGIDRDDDRWDVVASADYLMNRGVALFVEAGHYEQSSEGLQPGREYEINRAVFGIKLRR